MGINKAFVEVEPTTTKSKVPNVQELVKNDPLRVPERYIRDLQERPSTFDPSHFSSEIPVIDFSLLSTGCQNELEKLDKACKEWGFFQLVNHGVAIEVLQDMKDATAEFFELPLDEKEKYAMPENMLQGYGHAHIASDYQILDWSDILVLRVHPPQYRMFQYWPTSPNKFKECIEAYSDGIRRIGEQLLGLFSVMMGMDKDAILRIHKELLQGLRMNYYPACSRPDQVLGISPHSDSSTITILMQDDDVAGLQIKHQGKWVPVKPIPNTLVVNVGDVIEILSNGKYKSIEHRAVTNAMKPRISYVTFLAPRLDVEIEPLDTTIGSQKLAKRYKKVLYGDLLKFTVKKLSGKTAIEMLKIET